MEDLKEVSLKIKVDSYKDLQNYIHNELKLTKKDIEEMLEKLIVRVVENKLSDSVFLSNYVEKVVRESIGKLSKTQTWNIEINVNNAIEKVVGEQIMKSVREQVKNINILNQL